RHLLNWSSGLAWQEDYEFAPLKSSVVAMLYTRGRDDMAGFVAETPQARPPGLRGFGDEAGHVVTPTGVEHRHHGGFQ
ncbi:hypothetical protein ACV35D_32830, partial [Pseudomonas aeruginosa]